MALGGRDVLRLIVDADSSGAVREFDKLGRSAKSNLGDVEKQATGLSGKLGKAFDGLAQKSPMVSSALAKMGLSGQQAGAAIATAIPMAAVAAGAAVAAFAAKGVSDFQKVALAAGKFGEASGLGVEQASRWLEVANDIGISGDVVQSAFIKMEKALGANKSAFADMVVVGKNGAVDLTATFLNVTKHLQNIEDPIKRATESSKLFGKGFAEVAQLIGMDADDLRKRLQGVSEVKVITPAELEKARRFQESMNQLKDSAQEAGMMLGQILVPALTDLAKFSSKAIEIIVDIKQKTGGDNSMWFMNIGDLAKTAWSGLTQGKAPWDLAADGAENATARMSTSLDGYLSHIVPATAATGDYGSSVDAASGNVGQLASDLERANDALAVHTSAILAAFDSTFAVSDAERQFAESLMAAEVAAQDSTKSAGELQQAYDKETQEAVAVAEAHVRLAEDQAKASGKALSAADAQGILIGELQKMASQASGPTRDALLGLIANLQTTGQQKPQPTVTLNDQATPPLQVVEDRLARVGRITATSTIAANDRTGGPFADANSRGNAWDGKTFTATITAQVGTFHVPYLHADGRFYSRGGLVPGSKGKAQPAVVHGGEYVLSADVVDRIRDGRASAGAMPTPLASAGGGGGTTVINLSGTFLGSKAEFGRIVDEALAESRRRGNRAA